MTRFRWIVLTGQPGSGKTRMAGVWREDVTYANSGTAYYCSTGNVPFDATQQ